MPTVTWRAYQRPASKVPSVGSISPRGPGGTSAVSERSRVYSRLVSARSIADLCILPSRCIGREAGAHDSADGLAHRWRQSSLGRNDGGDNSFPQVKYDGQRLAW